MDTTGSARAFVSRDRPLDISVDTRYNLLYKSY